MYVADLERALDIFGLRLYQLYGQGESPMTIPGSRSACMSATIHTGTTDLPHAATREAASSCASSMTRTATCRPAKVL